ncbi:hypothetical protein Hanom_Chr08g00706541 [Helianthus anomalus]
MLIMLFMDETCESANLLYTLIGSDKVYSTKDFPIKNVNQFLIDKVFEDSTRKFLGKSSPRVVVTQCACIPKDEVRKQYGNKKLPDRQKQNHDNQIKRKGKRVQNKKFQKINFVKSRGNDKIETFENKSNTDFVKEVQILKRNSQNNYTRYRNNCDVDQVPRDREVHRQVITIMILRGLLSRYHVVNLR